MRVHCLTLVRDEADILGHTLDAALEWAHAIYVLDNGSSDGTWELLQDYAARHPQIILAGRDHGPYRTALWGELANQFIRNAEKGDWWCRLDADEIYLDDPRRFLADVDPRDQIVFSISIHYYFTDLDLAAYECDPSRYIEHWEPARLRHYLANWSEPRFVRHLSRLRWREEWPPGFWHMRASPQRIRLRHYQYRSPPQIERRIQARITRTQPGRFLHEKAERWVPIGLREKDLLAPSVRASETELWRTRLVRADALHCDSDDGELHIDPQWLPPIWIRPSPLRRAWQRLRWWG
jgi:hypothetical protein